MVTDSFTFPVTRRMVVGLKLSGRALLVYALIEKYQGETGLCISFGELAKILGTTPSIANNAVRTLRERGLIEVTRTVNEDGTDGINVYRTVKR